jgi:hypothetical protein
VICEGNIYNKIDINPAKQQAGSMNKGKWKAITGELSPISSQVRSWAKITKDSQPSTSQIAPDTASEGDAEVEDLDSPTSQGSEESVLWHITPESEESNLAIHGCEGE